MKVAIVASSFETLQSLESYLHAAGVSTRGTLDIGELARLARTSIVAAVVFPDDFAFESVVAAISQASERRRELLPILVTAHPKRFEALASGGGGGTGSSDERRALVVPRPAWGWTILEMIRAHVDGELEQGVDG